MAEGGDDIARASRHLAPKVAARFAVGMLALGVLVFAPAGSLGYANGWLFLGSLALLMCVAYFAVLRRDPALLEKRMRAREREARQRGIVAISLPLMLGIFALPGLDWRMGWSRVPAWLVAAATLVMAAGYLLFVLVLRENSFLSRVVEVQEGQKVIDTGPYAVVRHPMYVATLAIYLAAPLVLGSYWALIPAAAYVPLLAARIANEEELLLRELPGYAEYCRKVKWRLIPAIW